MGTTGSGDSMTPDRGEDRDAVDLAAVSDALIDLERLTARIVNTLHRGARPTQDRLTALTEIHSRIAKACGLGDD